MYRILVMEFECTGVHHEEPAITRHAAIASEAGTQVVGDVGDELDVHRLLDVHHAVYTMQPASLSKTRVRV